MKEDKNTLHNLLCIPSERKQITLKLKLFESFHKTGQRGHVVCLLLAKVLSGLVLGSGFIGHPQPFPGIVSPW